MYTIGQFAKLGQVSLKLLRFYDRIGLLEPAYVHPETAYRYYTLDQLSRLNRIIALKNLGLSLKEVQSFLDSDISIDELRGMLKLKQAQLRSLIEQEQQRLREVETRLYQLELADPLHRYDIAIKQIPSIKVASLRRIIPHGDAIAPLFGELSRTLPKRGLPIGIFHLDCYVDERCQTEEMFSLCDGRKIQAHQFPGSSSADFEAAFPVDDFPAAYELPAETMALLIYHGSFANRHYGYIAFSHWARQSGYCVKGKIREVYLRVEDSPYHPENLLEIQFPIEKC